MRRVLQNLRKKLGYTQAEAACKAGISRSHYTKIENGQREPSLTYAIKIKKAFNYYNDDLFENILDKPIIINLKTVQSNKIHKNESSLDR
ncbi:helix-turn-helix transcriptional regulator [Sinanaerobacter sp. ZZT-01]|uniref:helix-turn-helix transcriptional regulator n=1 Tax=Sinanaerobacter sp. ZZT-01 TaxID=3111540 RepID=UPI002D79FCDE|nr:helix-turn-helix transcriptional regulator [Sinanaerobacter sp. ZZT-01]WRR93350.1 helix-turn-helix transcriptional regulator [Sinanaerobacter sp. ZZT-01]